MNNTTVQERSPLRDRPLRHAGQSIDEELEKLFADLSQWYWLAVCWVLAAVMTWISTLTHDPGNPWTMSVIAVAAVIYSGLRIRKIRIKGRQLKLGRDGEKIVAEILEELTRSGAIVLHDILGDGFNIDHVICSRRGIFAIETKTRSKPAKGNANVEYDGTYLLVAGYEPDRNPLVQAAAQAGWLERTLLASTGKTFAVKPAIVFPGWFVVNKARNPKVWVMNPKALLAFIRNVPESISESDLHLIVFHLMRYIRTR